MRRIVSLLLAFSMLASLNIVSASATGTKPSPVTARYYLDEHIPEGTTITDGDEVSSVSGLAEAGTGWSDAWGISDTEYTELNGTRQVKNWDNEWYFGAGSTGGYNRHMTNTISTTEDGVYYVRFSMVNGQKPAHATSTVSAYFGLGSSKLTSNRDVITIGIESFPNETSHAATVNGEDTDIDLDMATPYDILLKLAVDADGDDKLSAEFVKKGSGFSGNWDYETTVCLGDKALDFVHFWPKTYGKYYFKDIEIESYNTTTTLLDEVKEVERIVASVNSINYLDCIERVEMLLPDGKHKELAIAEITNTANQRTDAIEVDEDNFCYIDANGRALNCLADASGSLGARVTVKNLYTIPKTVSLYIAIYKDDKMEGVSSDTGTLSSGEQATFTALLGQDDLPADLLNGGYAVRAFLFDENLTPLASFEPLKTNVVYVSPEASGGGDGRIYSPYTLAEAVENAKALTRAGKELPVYTLKGGKYVVDSTISISNFSFGTEDNPFILRAADGEDVTFIGGEFIPISDFTPVTDELVKDRLHPDAGDKIVRVNLKEHDITDYGVLSPYGNLISIYRISLYKYRTPYPSFEQNEVFFGGERMTVARWPNNAEAAVGEVITEGTVMEYWRDDMDYLPEGWVAPADRNVNEIQGPNFTISDSSEEPPWQRWSQADDIMLYGRLCYEWADEGMPVSVSDEGVITSQYPVAYGVKEGANFYLWNILEELDTPGEWYLDRENGEMYFYPTDDGGDDVIISTLEAPVFSINNSENIIFDGFTIECGKKHGISITGSKNVILDSLTIRNMSQNGVYSEELTDCKILNCEIYGCGENGVTLDGGNLTTLERGNNLISNCHIYSNAKIKETYSPAIRLTGCGNTASHNEIHDMPHAGIIFNGSYNTVEYNELYDVVHSSNDMGAIYSYRSRTGIGCVVRHNYIHDLVPLTSNLVVNPMQPGVYLDGGRSFVTVESNIFENLGAMAILQSGRANTITNNIFINVGYIMRLGCGTWGNDVTDKQLSDTGLVAVRNGTLDLSQPPYSEVEHLPDIMEDDPLACKHVVFDNNVLVNNTRYYDYPWGSDEMTFAEWKAHEDNDWTEVYKVSLSEAGFNNANQGDYTLRTDSSIYTAFPDFASVDFANAGRK